MRRLTDRDLAEVFAAAANIERMYRAADTTEAIRRVNEHGYNGLTAAQLEQAITSSGHSDPTVHHALNGLGRQIDDASLITAWRRLTLAVEARMPGLTRPTQPTKEETASTDPDFDADAVFRPGEGTCAACGRHYVGGRRRQDRVRSVDGHLLCYSHETSYRAVDQWRNIDDYIAHIRAQPQWANNHPGDAA